MKLATLACLAALCLLGAGARAAPGDPPRNEQPRTEQPRADQPRTDQPKTDQPRADQPRGEQPRAEPSRSEAARAAQPVAGGARERRRRSYAACNRASHQRGYVGGRRRRFLIRCRLGYERTRGQPAPAAAAPATPQPGRKP